ncbi:MAG: ShlB/FhaC/HecB family hemolysin secretion/activation protein [Ferruginibacter sp.]
MNYRIPVRELIISLILMPILNATTFAQAADDSTYIILPASVKYQKSPSYQKKWGKHYRKEWAMPVKFSKVNIDTLAGGLKPYQTGGGRQSKSIRLRDNDEREYVLRSIDKSFGKALPEIAQGTFIEALVNDQVTIGHPYSAVTIAPMAEAAGIFLTNPLLFYVPKQPALGNFSDSMGNTLYLFEQRPDENWETAANFGNSANIVSTEKMLQKIHNDNDNQVDQQAFVRARIFDMFIGDWGRHDDQWRWATFKDDKKTLYVPIPRDRDQAYTLFDGSLLKRIIRLSGIKELQSFDSTIKDVVGFNSPAHNMDFHLTNQVTIQQWVDIATDLQQKLTDNIIDQAIKKLPAEVYPLSGLDIATKLKGRRNHLAEYARQYASFLSEEIDITGSADDELFDVKRLNDNETEIFIYKITNEGKVKEKPFYHRLFTSAETKEIRLYGLNGNDQYKVSGNVNNAIKIRLIGGEGKDIYTNESVVVDNNKKVLVYDDKKNNSYRGSNWRKHLSNDRAIHQFDYDQFEFNSRGIRPIALYSFEDRFYIGLAYNIKKHAWRKKPFAQQHSFDVKYSISQKAFSSTYKGIFTEAIGKWDLKPMLNYDAVQWNNYFGLGNESIFKIKDRNYHRLRTQRFYAELGLERILNTFHKITLSPFVQSIEIINDSGRYLSKLPIANDPETFKAKGFAGVMLTYVYQKLNDSILPVKGISFKAWGSFTSAIKDKNNFIKYGTEFRGYVPLSKKFSLAIKAGAAALSGTAQFYQYNSIGGHVSLRGYERDRFYGRTKFYNQNELRWITDFRTYVMNGKIGLFALYDVGRVWMKPDNSNTWHPGYGGGFILSPFNKISVSAAYAISPEEKRIHFDLIKVF